MTKVASVKVIGLAAIIAILIGFLGKFTALVSTIPDAVLGGVSLLLYGFIAINGLKVLIEKQINFEISKNIVVASSMLVLGLGGAAISIATGDLNITISGMSLASIVGILLNLLLPDEVGYEQEVVNKKKNNIIESKSLEEEIDKLKNDIKDELTISLKEEIIEAIKNELNTGEKKKSKKKE